MKDKQANTLRSGFARAIMCLIFAFAAFGGQTASAQDQIFAYSDTGNQLISFSSASPGTATTVPITGTQAGELLVGLDFRPANGLLYAIGDTDRIYIINPTTGVATAVNSTPFTPTIDGVGQFVGFDFNPIPDRIRMVNTATENLRNSPDTGQVTNNDTDLTYAAGDPGASQAAINITSAAYTNSFVGTPTTTLYAIDFFGDTLVTIGSINGTPNSPNGGVMNTVGSLGIVTSSGYGAFDIAPRSNVAYAALRVSGVSNLYTINLTTGAATLVGRIGTAAQNFRVDGLAVVAPAQVPTKTLYDFDGDKRADYGVFRPSNGQWSIQNSNGTFKGAQWGTSSDRLTPADFDGDNITDFAVWREAPAEQAAFYIINSQTNTASTRFLGATGDNPIIVGDWDGDGRADPAVYRASNSVFYYRGSLNNPGNNISAIGWGAPGDQAVNGNFDTDAIQDAAVFRPSENTWYVRLSTTGALRSQVWGLSTDRRVPFDYDGDGRTDFAVYRDGLWAILLSGANQQYYRNWGAAGDQLAAADYDGDRRTDFGVFRDGVFYILPSTSITSGSPTTTQGFGATGDRAVANSYTSQ